MLKILTVVVVSCLFQNTIACCCFRDAWTLPSCGCSDTCIIVTANPNPCNPAPSSCCRPCYQDTCNCGPPGPCYRDVSNVCVVYDNPSPICSCLKSISEPAKCGSRCGSVPAPCSCGCGFEEKYIYFPEVEYPTIALDVKPYYFSSCWSV